MSGLDTPLGPAAPALAIAAMALATYLCRIAGVLIMRRVRMTPAIERALGALPGSIVAATIVPIGLGAGSSALLAIVAGIAVMRLVRNDLLALVAGLATASGARFLGF